MSIECDYCPMQPRIITLCYITIIIKRAAYMFAFGFLHTHTVSLTLEDPDQLKHANFRQRRDAMTSYARLNLAHKNIV